MASLPTVWPGKPVIPSIAWVLKAWNAMRQGAFPASRITQMPWQSAQPAANTQSKMLSRAKVQEILANRPAGVDPSEILGTLQRKWYVLEWLTPDLQHTPPPTTPQDEWVSMPSADIGKIWLAAWGVVWWLWALKVGGEGSQKLGKFLYGLTLPPTADEAGRIQAHDAWVSSTKPVTTVQTALDQPLVQRWWRTLSSKVWLMGTKSWIWVQAAARAREIWQTQIEPFFVKAAELGKTASADEILAAAQKYLEGAKNYSSAMKWEIQKDIKLLLEDMWWSTDLKNLDLLSQEIRNKVPNKYLQWEKATKSLTEAQKIVQKAMKWKIYDVASEIDPKLAKAYIDYGNLKGLWKMGKVAMTQAWRKWGTWWLISWIVDELLTPASTIAGKTAYKAWKAATYIPDKVMELIKSTSGKASALKGAIWTIIDEMPAWMLAESFGNVIEKSAKDISSWEAIKSDIQAAIKNLSEGKSISSMSKYARIATKWMDKKSAIKYLTKVLSTIK